MSRHYHLAPSVLSADMASLGVEVRECWEYGADYIHIDVMDGMFVPNITIGAPVLRSIRPHTGAAADVHLMIEEPGRYIDDFADAGADIITVHQEACRHLDRTLQAVRDRGLRVGVSLNPATPIETLSDVLPTIDMVLLMGVNPGFGNQRFIPYVLDKIRSLRRVIDERGLSTDIEVDGGVSPHNARELIEAGANILVAGSAVFGSDKESNIASFLEIMNSYE